MQINSIKHYLKSPDRPHLLSLFPRPCIVTVSDVLSMFPCINVTVSQELSLFPTYCHLFPHWSQPLYRISPIHWSPYYLLKPYLVPIPVLALPKAILAL